MKVSIVTISFNQAQFLERAIRSVIEQNYTDIEYIVVDPGSVDGSRDIIERYRDRITKIIYEPDEGPADGLNKGFARAAGDVFGYINSDDTLLPGAITEVVKEFTRHRNTDIVVGHGYIIDRDGNTVRRFRSAPFSSWRYVHGASVIMQQSTFFRREIFQKIGGFNNKNFTCWDSELILSMSLSNAKIRTLNKYLSIFTQHPDSITSHRHGKENYQMDQHRFFRMVMGRDPTPLDIPCRMIARVQRWALDPIGAAHRLSDNVLGPPKLF